MIGLLLFVAGCFAHMVIPPARAQDQRRFDYQCAYVGGGTAFSKDSVAEATTANIKSYGAQGWELTTMDANFFACFKRPL